MQHDPRPAPAAAHLERPAPPPIPPGEERLIVAIGTAACLTLLAIAIYLQPDSRGYGTHEQLFLLPCGFYKVTSLPCPTCGMTTAYANMVRFRIGAALRAQSFGTLLCVLSTAGGLVGLFCLTAGIPVLYRIERMSWRWPSIFLVSAFFASWAGKALHLV